ncbi:Aldo/keto reductase [Teratosphaeria destructans]|uniref:Aldo/keto reductase n=1 Tax=Teratosphaeria destructans TaxID=418781 RepID=A0A9W7SZY7_9PEZI|nr:Aldo/keto reductase [Teratosphaeria destructans]
MSAQQQIQLGLSLGMSSTAGYHDNTPKPFVEHHPDFDNEKFVTPKDFVPTRDTRPEYRGKYENIKGAPIIVGAWPWGDSSTFGWRPEEADTNEQAWLKSVELGINQVDTAPIYGTGRSEQLCGRFFKTQEQKFGAKRQDYLFQTKFSGLPSLPKTWTEWSNAPRSFLEDSLKHSGLEYVDAYLVHGPIHPQSIETIAKAIAELVDEKKIKVVGLANANKDDILAYKTEFEKYGVPLAFVQNEFSILRRLGEVNGVLDVCREHNILFQGYSALANGRLTGKWSPEHDPPKSYRFSQYPMKDIQHIVDVVLDIADKRTASEGRNVTAAGVALNYLLVKGAYPVVSVRNPAQAENNASALGWRLSEEERERIDRVSLVGQPTAIWQRG